MQDLRIVGVETEGQTPRLLLCDDAGTEYALDIDQALRTAVGRAPSAGSTESQKPSPALSPRDIQARLRAGATLDQVVADSGLSREHVLRYAGPVADERAFFAGRARETVVARASSAETHRLAFGDAPATLEAMVKVQLRAAGVSLATMSWDAWRREDGLWAVVCDFDPGSSETHAGGIGQKPPAEWTFDPSARTVRPENKWAESLSSLPTAPARVTSRGRRLAPVDEPFDVDGDVAGSPAPRSAAAARHTPGTEGASHEDLLEILRARRGQRLGTDESGDEKLATLLTRDEQAETAATPKRAAPPTEDTLPGLGEKLEEEAPEPEAERTEEHIGQLGTDAWGFSYEEPGDEAGESEPEAPAEPEPKKRKSSRRPTMPRWDDILFGGKD
ncbi:septation protein SepH [Nesterenkonia ebinurensis]|uniref:septation protein SepH n=1 Tax=Nesterenkonia ebinurensis TaxID=2608252 RepID=UPI00123D577A|nr:septation protein SepH [Nesterenkonia ebinurensis]